MKTKSKSKANRKKPIIIGSLLVVATVAVLGTLWYMGGQRDATPETTTTTNTPVTSQSDSNEQDDTSAVGNTAQDTKSNTTTTTTTTPDPTKTSTLVTIVSANQTGKSLAVRAYISTPTDNGTCTFTFTKDSSIITRQTDILQGPSTSPCETLTIVTSEFPSLGKWQLVVSFASSTLSGSSTQQAIEIK